MNERLFQFIWEYALFDTNGLFLEDGRAVYLLRQGTANKDAGPDFIGARIQIDHTTWVGNVELHLRESDWNRHRHEDNRQYQNIILHVVLEADGASPKGNFPVLNLSGRINCQLLQHYQQLMNRQQPIACSNFYPKIPSLVWTQWTDRLLYERWEQKTEALQAPLEQSKNDWNQLLYRQLARYFGAATNTDAFQQLASCTPFTVLARHRHNLTHLEAILFGQAGLLPTEPAEPYSIELSIHYAFLRQKYALSGMEGHEWKFLRMRPAHFPTIRIAQFAMLIQRSGQLFAQLIHAGTLTANMAQSLLQVGVSDYWQQHYVFEKVSVNRPKILGKQMIHNLLINAVIPLRLLYARCTGKADQWEFLTDLLRALPAEENHITAQWVKTGYSAEDAYTSQSLIQLYEQYCIPKKCLNCAVGVYILKR